MMISELKYSDFYLCSNLLYEFGQLEVRAVVEGIAPGRVFVDNAECPTTGFVWLGNNDGFIFIGNEQNTVFIEELNQFIDNVIVPDALKIGLDSFEAIGNHPKWNTIISEVFKHRDLKSWNQKVYRINRESINDIRRKQLEEGYSVVEVTKALYSDQGTGSKGLLQEMILEFWSSPEQFFNNGIAYAVVHKNEVVSLIYSGFVVNNIHAIGIETLKQYRRKGLAQNVAAAYVEACLKQNISLYWDCMEENKASVALAERLGFNLHSNYKGFYFLI